MKFQKYIFLIFLLLLFLPISLIQFFDNKNNRLNTSLKVNTIEESDSWTKRWSILGLDWANGIAIDSFNNIFVLGGTENPVTNERYNFLAKFNNSGNLVWLHQLDNYNSSWFHYHTIKIYNDNKIYLAGNLELQEDQNQYMILSKYDNEGKQIWNKTWGGYMWLEGNDMDIDSLGNIYIVGSILLNQSNYRDMYLVKLNNSGVILWNHTWGGEEDDKYNTIAIDFNNNIYVAGSYYFNSIMMKYNASSYCEWNYTWNNYYYDYSLTIDSDNNILLADETVLQKLNSNRTLLWNYTLSKRILFSPKLITDAFNNIFLAENRLIKCYDNSFFVESECICSAIYLEKFNSSGNLLWQKRCTGCGDASGYDISINSIGDVYISGTLRSEFGCIDPVYDALLMKNPTAFEGVCVEIYYDLLILIIMPQIIIGLIFLIILIRRRKSLTKI